MPTFRVLVERGRVLVDPTPLPAGTETTPAKVPPLLVAARRPFSTARFEFGTTPSFEGWVEARPYPTLLVDRPDGGHSREQVAGLEGKRVRLDGSLIYRDDQTMIELSGTPSEIDAGAGRPAEGWSEDLGVHTYVGGIVDSKCFLGVMKPGSTKPHRACATRCISGGVPPVLLVRDADGNASYLLLASKDGDSVNAAVLNPVAEPVEITGQVVRYDDLLVLRADPNSYQRIE